MGRVRVADPMTWCEEPPPPPWWRKLLWKVFPWTKPKCRLRTMTTLKFKDEPNRNGDVYPQTIQMIIEEENLTDRCLRESGFSMSIVTPEEKEKS